MKPQIMDYDIDWERIKNEQLVPLLLEEGNEVSLTGPVMTVGSSNEVDNLLMSLVQQAARN